jgi:hypothetical protein
VRGERGSLDHLGQVSSRKTRATSELTVWVDGETIVALTAAAAEYGIEITGSPGIPA